MKELELQAIEDVYGCSFVSPNVKK